LGLGAVYLCAKTKAGWRAALALVAAVGVSDALCARAIKPLVGRARPCNEVPPRSFAPDGCGRGLSFPSNHASNAAAGAMVLAALAPRLLWGPLAGLALLMGL